MELVTINSIRDGVMAVLSSAFPTFKIYGEEIQQGFQEPCFFVQLLSPANNREMGRRFMRHHNFNVMYFPQTPKNRNAHNMAEQLYSLFSFVTIGGSIYQVTSTRHEVVDGVLHFFFDIDFMVWEEKVEYTKMQSLKQEGRIK